MKKLKDQTILDYTIKIYRVREVRKIGKKDFIYKDTVFLVDIKNCLGDKTSFSVSIGNHSDKSLRECFKKIQEELL